MMGVEKMGKFNKKILSFVAVGAFSSLLISCSETPQTSEKETVQNTLSQTGAVSDNTANLSENTTSGVATVITEIPETSADTVQTTIQSKITTVTDQTTITPTVPNETQATEATTVTEKQNENNAPSFDIDDSVIVTVNQDGSFHVKFQEADCSITFPAHWSDKFVIRHNTVYAKKAFYNGFDDGKLFSVYFSDELISSGYPFKCRGKASGKYCYISYPTDCRVDMTNKEEADEYNMMSKESFDFVHDSLACEPLDERLDPVLYGEISSGGREIEGYTTSYVCDNEEKSVQWICEDTWHITAHRVVYSHGVQWYECWDTDDGDYYGWIDGNFLVFYLK